MEFQIENNFGDQMSQFQKYLEETDIIPAYQGLIQFIRNLKRYLGKTHPEYHLPTQTYYGYLDMIYFSFTPEVLNIRKLKIVLVFSFNPFGFEIWLSGKNREVQKQYWNYFQENEFGPYQLTPQTKWADSILVHVVDRDPDFNDLTALMERLEGEILEFASNVEALLQIKV